ncbi:response regulator [Azospirillum doebereinerae]|uniref:Response regulator n=1 Tax=Azospirillum doebereinerae TaxID=92933 RepID=A0A3S0WKJ0_9PROT|nr:response regulator [Azospirillum doebereinerae]MCG5241350.1 response regulator [Azospirillum doebereinerae]RUQ68083.1 response regulator [Azospirillum doebereinerae]
MPDYDFSQVDAAIIDSQLNTARVFRDVLVRMSFRRMELFDSVKAASGLLSAGTPDVILVDADGEDTDAFRFIRALRNEPKVPNPFACLIVTTWAPTPALLTRVTNTGADDLLLKPVSPKQVQDRIASLIEGRKGFVVTADYTGPDRRKSPREGAQVPVLDAPNTLRLKATGQWNQAGVRMLLNEAIGFVTTQKRVRASVQVAFLAEFAMPGLSRPTPDRLATEHVGRIGGFLDDLLRRLSDEGDHAHVEAVARAVKSLAESIHAQAERGAVEPGDVAQLQTMVRALMQATDPDRPLEAMTREVTAAVNGYRSRLEQMAQAKAAAALAAATPVPPEAPLHTATASAG